MKDLLLKIILFLLALFIFFWLYQDAERDDRGEIMSAGNVDAMNKTMLAANISIPLSSFALVDDQYVIYGALSVNSSLEDIVHDIEVLSSNTIEAIDAMSDYLN